MKGNLELNSYEFAIGSMAEVINTNRDDQGQTPRPAWVKTLLNFAEELALNPHNLDDSKCPAGWLPNRRVGIDSKFKTCVRILDEKLETVPHWAIQEMNYFERQELKDEESPLQRKAQKKIPSSKQAVNPGNKRKQQVVQNESNKRSRMLTTNMNESADLKPQRRQQLNHATIIPPTIPSSGDMYIKSQWKRQWNFRSVALHFPSAKTRKKGQQVLYLCQSCPRIHDNLALRLALWMAKKLSLPLQVLSFLPKDVVSARELKKAKRKTWRAHTFRRKAFAEFSVALQAYKIPLVGLTIRNGDHENASNLNTGYVHAKMLAEWANVATPHFIVTDDTHCAYHNSEFKRYIVGHKETFTCPIFQMDNDSMYPPRLMKPLKATDSRITTNPAARKSYVMPFHEYARVLSRHRSDRSGHINLFDKELCPDRLKRDEIVDLNVQLPLYLVGNGGGDSSALSTPPFVPDDIACTYDIINWVTTLDRLNRANDSPLWDGSELAGLGYVPRLIQSTMSSGNRGGSQSYTRTSVPQKLTGGFSMEFADVSLVESVLSYIRIGSLSTRMILRSFCNGQCVDDAVAGISKVSMKDYTLQSNNQVLPFRNPKFCELDKLIVTIREYRLYRVRMAYSCHSDKIGSEISDTHTSEPFSINQLVWKKLVPQWCQENLQSHAKDKARSSSEECFPGQLEKRATIDRFWNGLQWRLKYKGVIHPACVNYWTYKIFRYRHSSPIASYDLMVQFLRSYLLGGYLTDEVFAMCAEIFHMNLTHVDVTDASLLQRLRLVDSSRDGFVNERTSIETIKKRLSRRAFDWIMDNGVRKSK